MFTKPLRLGALCLVFAGVTLAKPVDASTTIMKFGFGADSSPDLEMLDGLLRTLDDGNALSSGDQDTGLEFLGFLSSMPGIPVADASISIDGVTLTDGLSEGPGYFLQPTEGGSFSIWDDTDSLLLSGTFGDGLLTGSVGAAATGSLISLSFGTFDGGSLQSLVDPSSAAISLSFAGVNDGQGFSIVDGETPQLDRFVADSTGLVAAAVPEPTGMLLMCMAAITLTLRRGRM